MSVSELQQSLPHSFKGSFPLLQGVAPFSGSSKLKTKNKKQKQQQQKNLVPCIDTRMAIKLKPPESFLNNSIGVRSKGVDREQIS